MDYSPGVARRFGAAASADDSELGGPGILVCGDAEDRTLNVWIRFEVQVHDRTIRHARFRAYGCPHTIAAASWAAESLRGAPASALERFDVERVLRELNIPREKLGKLLRIEDAMRACARRLAEPAEERPLG